MRIGCLGPSLYYQAGALDILLCTVSSTNLFRFLFRLNPARAALVLYCCRIARRSEVHTVPAYMSRAFGQLET